MTDITPHTTHNLNRPPVNQLTAQELAESLLAVRSGNEDHLALCAEAAHRILVLKSGNDGLTTEADRLRYHMRLANARVDDMRNGMVTLHARMDDLRRTTDLLAPRAPVQLHNDARLRRLHPGLIHRIITDFGQASMCWENPAGAGTFDSARATTLATNLALHFADELELAKLRRTDDDGIDWRRRALEAELRADAMRLGILNAEAGRLQEDLATEPAPAAGGLFAWFKRLF